MAVRKRGDKYHIRFFKDKKEVWVTTSAALKRDAQAIEQDVKRALRTGDYSNLSLESRLVAIRLFQNQKWEIPKALVDAGNSYLIEPETKEKLTFWKAIELFLMYPEIKNSPNRERHIAALGNVIEEFGKDYPVNELWIPQIKGYQIKRLKEGAKASTINKEKAALSKMFKVLSELKYVHVNPAQKVPYLSENSDKRHVYISWKDFLVIATAMPEWFRPVVQTAYYTGMRRGEILGMTRRKVNLTKRVIYLAPPDVKEKDWKRVPIHRDLVPILEEVMSANVVGLDRLFLRNGNPVLHKNQVRWPWDEGMDQLPDFSPRPHFHDLRHAFKTNARRSHLDSEYVSAIMGHAGRAKSTDEGYGWISDEELVKAIDKLTFDHGDTVIWTADAK